MRMPFVVAVRIICSPYTSIGGSSSSQMTCCAVPSNEPRPCWYDLRPSFDHPPDVWRIRKHESDTAPILGEGWPRSYTVGQEATICVIPRDSVPKKGLAGAVEEATFPLPRAMFTKEAWVLEPKPVMDLLDKIRRNGVPLAEYAGVKPLYGIKTGLNEAFLIGAAKHDELVRADPNCAEVMKPYLRGQDIARWSSPESGQP